MKTIRERLTAALEARGCYKVDWNTRKFIVLRSYHPGEWYFFLGKAGALRVGRTSTSSTPVKESFRQELLKNSAYQAPKTAKEDA